MEQQAHLRPAQLEPELQRVGLHCCPRRDPCTGDAELLLGALRPLTRHPRELDVRQDCVIRRFSAQSRVKPRLELAGVGSIECRRRTCQLGNLLPTREHIVPQGDLGRDGVRFGSEGPDVEEGG